ncbi:MAG: PIG-L deacetylase family protein [Myxococcota bacterium]
MTWILPHPPDLFAPGRRHLVLLAHHDDELPYAGLLSRMGADVRVVWLTNSDGLAHEDGTAPEDYAEQRRLESLDAMSLLGVGEERLRVLGHSEYALYDLFARMGAGELGGRVPERFLDMADEVEDEVRRAEPDVVWTLAWQGGHPEHDLMHLYAARAVRRLARERGRQIPFYELPAYELIVVGLRFKPWSTRPIHAIDLTSAELEAKQRMLDCYPTQARVLGEFERLIGIYGLLARLRGRRVSFDGFAAREEFAPIPQRRDYTRSTHLLPILDYPGDDYRGLPIRSRHTLLPIAAALGLG